MAVLCELANRQPSELVINLSYTIRPTCPTHSTRHVLTQVGAHRHAVVLRELANVAARELVIEQSVNAVEEAFDLARVKLVEEEESGIPGVCVCERDTVWERVCD